MNIECIQFFYSSPFFQYKNLIIDIDNGKFYTLRIWTLVLNFTFNHWKNYTHKIRDENVTTFGKNIHLGRKYYMKNISFNSESNIIMFSSTFLIKKIRSIHHLCTSFLFESRFNQSWKLHCDTAGNRTLWEFSGHARKGRKITRDFSNFTIRDVFL